MHVPCSVWEEGAADPDNSSIWLCAQLLVVSRVYDVLVHPTRLHGQHCAAIIPVSLAVQLHRQSTTWVNRQNHFMHALMHCAVSIAVRAVNLCAPVGEGLLVLVLVQALANIISTTSAELLPEKQNEAALAIRQTLLAAAAAHSYREQQVCCIYQHHEGMVACVRLLLFVCTGFRCDLNVINCTLLTVAINARGRSFQSLLGVSSGAMATQLKVDCCH